MTFYCGDTWYGAKLNVKFMKIFQIVHIPSYLELNNCLTKTKYFRGLLQNGKYTEFSDNLTKGAFGGGTVTYENLQIAVHLGLNQYI